MVCNDIYGEFRCVFGGNQELIGVVSVALLPGSGVTEGAESEANGGVHVQCS